MIRFTARKLMNGSNYYGNIPKSDSAKSIKFRQISVGIIPSKISHLSSGQNRNQDGNTYLKNYFKHKKD